MRLAQRRMRGTVQPTPSTLPLDATTRFRVQVKHAVAIGPGKAGVLQAIAETVSIAESGRRLGTSDQRAWSLAQAMNGEFVAPLVRAQRSGTAGGGAGMTEVGRRVLAIDRAVERDAQRAVARRLPQPLELILPQAGGGARRPVSR